MSVLNVIQNPNQQDPYCSFYFQDPANPKKSSRKILVKKSDICRYMYCMINLWVFKDGTREVSFRKVKDGIESNTTVNGQLLQYVLYDSEKRQVDNWIQANLL